MSSGAGSGAHTVAFLCAELAESSETLARLGETRADEARRASSRLLRETVAAHGGHELQSSPDAVLATFRTASEAIGSAVALQLAWDRRHSRASEPTTMLRVGIQVGEASTGDASHGEDVPSSPEFQARELCRAAGGGQIVVSAIGYALAAQRTPHGFDRTGLLTLPGLAEPVATFEVRYERGPPLQLPLPPELADSRSRPPAFVGRKAELRRLGAAWRRAAGGERGVVFVSGEPGIGKTRLAAELARDAHTNGAVVLWGRCFEEALVPYQPFVQALRHVVAHEDPEELRAQVAVHASPLAHLVPELGRLIPDAAARRREDDPAGDRYRLFQAVAAFLSELSARAPLLLVLDDLQWADQASLLLLTHLAADPAPAAMLVLGTLRDTEVTRSHPLAQAQADIARERAVERVELEGLVEEEVGDLVGSLVGWTPAPGLARTLQTETSGNPFFLQEIVAHLEELSLLSEHRQPPRITAGTVGVPSGVTELVARRVQRLSRAAHDALGLAAIIGTEFELDVLGELLGTPDDALIEVLDEAVEARLLVETAQLGRYGFSHALIQQTLYEQHGVNRRAALHYRIGDTLERLRGEDLSASLAAIAYHYGAAGTRAADKILRYCPPAGRRALELVAYEDAVRHFGSALAAQAALRPADERARAALLLDLGTAQTRAGETEAALASFREAAELTKRGGDRETLARAALGYGGGAGFGGVWATYAAVDDVLVRLLEDALAAFPEESATRVRLLGRLAQALYWAPDSARSLELSDQALESARRLEDPVALAYALDSRHVVLWGPEDLEERLRLAGEMLALGEELGDRDIQLEAYAWLITDTLEGGSIEDVDRYIEAYARLADELRQPYHLWYTHAVRAMRAFLEGRYADTSRLAAEALGYGRHAHAENAEGTYRAQTTMLMLELGRGDELVDTLEQYVTASPLQNWRVALALAYAELERRDEALAIVEAFSAEGFTQVPRDCVWFATLGTLAKVVDRLDAAAHAPQLIELLRPFEDRNCVVGFAALCFGPVSRFLGMLARVAGDHDRALGYLHAALERSRALGSAPLVARTQVDTAAALLARRGDGDAEEAERLLDEAAPAAAALGMAALSREIEAVRARRRRAAAVA